MKPEYYQKIWAKVLAANEETKYEFTISGKYIRFVLIVWGVISAFLLLAMGLGIITFLIAYFYYNFYLRRANIYAFTNKRVLIHKGWLSTSLKSIDYDKITDLSVDQGFFERTFYKTGSITINTAGTGLPEVILRHIDQPYEIKKQLEKIKVNSKNRR
ncbi:PH domain-containing protein [Candidatus Parcubacteria bacterium]|nr:MAG: PH domain-containing protein [Candidatus Parcubacteria bacterium]